MARKKSEVAETVETAPAPILNGSNGTKPSDSEILALLATGISKAAAARQLGIKTYFVAAAVERSIYNGKLRPRAKKEAAPAGE